MMARKHQIRMTISLVLSALLSLCLLCGCSGQQQIHEGETYLDGAYYLSEGDLHVGYRFFSDGAGYLFIGSTVHMMRYGVYEQRLYLSVAGGEVESFRFEQTDEGILIDGLCYLHMEADPSYEESAKAMLSMQEQETKQEASGELPKTLIAALSGCLAVGLVWAIVRWQRKKRG